jgi:G:T-mismatch repair DNA endonuclease (very short patch repair protein)
MPRFVTRRKGRLKTKVRAERAGILRYRKGSWIDPFPNVLGTLPEKIVYAELSKRGIPFWFQNEVRFQIPEIDFDKQYRPDIAVPDVRIIIEVQGSYWHSKPEQIEADAYKFAIYQTLGWQVLIWWDYDILENVHELFAAEPKLKWRTPPGGFGSTETNVAGRRIIDDSKGIRTTNRRRALRKAYKKPAVRLRIKK